MADGCTMQVQNALVVQSHVSVNLMLLMVKATLWEIVPVYHVEKIRPFISPPYLIW